MKRKVVLPILKYALLANRTQQWYNIFWLKVHLMYNIRCNKFYNHDVPPKKTMMYSVLATATAGHLFCYDCRQTAVA